MKASRFAIAFGFVALPPVLGAQAYTPPPTIATSVAEAMTLEWSMLGRPMFYDARTPPDWPSGLIPAAARIIGGGSVGVAGAFRIQAAVFAFALGSRPANDIRAMLTAAGFTRSPSPAAEQQGGFLSSPDASGATAERYCKGMSIVTFAPVDSVRDPLVVSIHMMDGQAASSACNPRAARAMGPGNYPVKLPTLTAPSGGRLLGAGSSWSDGSGDVRSMLLLPISTDSALAHFRRQLVAGGWIAEGRGASADGAAIQRFSFRQGDEKWTAALTIVTTNDRHAITINMARAE
jgi:hypothetical protein